MHSFRSRIDQQNSPARRAAIESLESRTLLSASGTTVLLATFPDPVPTSAVAGATVHDHVKVNIANNGTGTYSGKTTVTLYASPDGTYNSTDAQLGTLSPHLNIRAGHNKNVTITVKTVPQNLDGNYFILADVIATTQTVMGVSTTTVSVTPSHVDLANISVKVPASIIHLGTTFNAIVEITNDGNETAKGSLDTLFELSTSLDGSNPFQVAHVTKHINLKATKSETLHLRVPTALGSPSGNQFVFAVVDPSETIPGEANSTNNTMGISAPVTFK